MTLMSMSMSIVFHVYWVRKGRAVYAFEAETMEEVFQRCGGHLIMIDLGPSLKEKE